MKVTAASMMGASNEEEEELLVVHHGASTPPPASSPKATMISMEGLNSRASSVTGDSCYGETAVIHPETDESIQQRLRYITRI